ncbi:MAG: phenylalanine--tRNA ligase subunit beta, partial [Phenylobacterium sp.]
MKFTPSWLREHLETDATVAEVVEAMTMAGLEVEHVDDPGARLAAFSVARIVEAVQHPNADRLRVCQVDTVDGRKEIVCGAPNARAGLTTIYAPIGACIPANGLVLEARPVRGVVSNGMLCSAAELETAEESDGILELDGGLAVGTPAAVALGLEAAIDFEVTPNRPDWLGVDGVVRDLAAAGLGRLRTPAISPVAGGFPCPVEIRLDDSGACPAFAGRLIRGVRNGPSPDWLQRKLISIGLRPISALVDITNLITFDRARPLHVYDAARLSGGWIESRLGREGERVEALDGKTYAAGPGTCVIADASGAIGLGGVMGGASTGCSETTTDVFVESAWFDPIRIAQTGRTLGIASDAQYRFARGVDPESLLPGLELATRLILDICGGEASEAVLAGQAPARPAPFVFDHGYVEALSGLSIGRGRMDAILSALGFGLDGETVAPPSWRRDVEGKADLVEEVARIAGYGALPSTPLPP